LSAAHSVPAVAGGVAGPAEVRKLDDSITVQDVLRLDVAVDHVLAVHVLQSHGHLKDVVAGSWLWVPSLRHRH